MPSTMTNNKNYLQLVFSALLILIPKLNHAIDIDIKTASELLTVCPKIRMAGGDWLDWMDLKNTNTGTGKSLLLIELIHKHLPAKLERQKNTPFSRQLYQLKEGNIDVIFGLYPEGDRLDNYEFTNSVFYEPLYTYTNKKLKNFYKKPDDLIGHRGVKVRSTHYGFKVDKIIRENPKDWQTVNKLKQAVAMVANNRAEFFIGGQYAEDLKKYGDQLTISDHPITYQPVSVAFSKKTDCKRWIPYINQLINTHLIKPKA